MRAKETDTYAAFFSFMAAVHIATGGATLHRTSPATFASRRLICPAWATAPGERTTPRSFAPRKSAPWETTTRSWTDPDLDDVLSKVQSGRVRMTAISCTGASPSQITVPLAELNDLHFRLSPGHDSSMGWKDKAPPESRALP
jgi:hypothetical protein